MLKAPHARGFLVIIFGLFLVAGAILTIAGTRLFLARLAGTGTVFACARSAAACVIRWVGFVHNLYHLLYDFFGIAFFDFFGDAGF